MKLADKFSDWSDLFPANSDEKAFLCQNNRNTEEIIHDYIETLLSIFSGASASQHASLPLFKGYCRILEELLFLNSVRKKYENQYSLSPAHPMVLMQHYVGTLARKDVDLYLDSKDIMENTKLHTAGVKELILHSLFDAQDRNRRQFQLMRPNQTYEAAPEPSVGSSQTGLYKAVPFSNRKNNTEIPAIRLYEKIENYVASLADSRKTLSELKIACFGHLTDTDTLQTLCRKNDLCPKMNLTCFEQDTVFGEYVFKAARESCSDGFTETYDLLHNGDLESLFRTYHIVIFLDLNCFYRQFQGAKTIEEKSALRNCQWYWERTEELPNLKFKSKAAYYTAIYDYIGMWLNSYRNALSGRFEFDERLFHALDMAYKGDAHVYLYLSHSDEIADTKLRNYNMCNDEYYDGKELIVYKFISESTADPTLYYKPFADSQKNTLQPEVTISLWKIVKSIGNSFYQMLIDKSQKNGINLEINDLMDTVCVLTCSEIINNTEAVISYSLQSRKANAPGYKEILNETIRVILEQAFGRKPLVCMRRYFKNLIVHYIVSNSESISDLLFAHLLSANQITKITLVPKGWGSPNENFQGTSFRENIDFKARNIVYSLIDRLADLRLRVIENRTDYFVDGIRQSYCPDMNESTFRSIMTNINHCCEKWGYTDSRLYMNSKIE